MAYRIEWIGAVAVGLITSGGRSIACSLEEDQVVPEEFKEGDAVVVQNHPGNPIAIAAGFENDGYYLIRHVRSGAELKTWHRANMYKVRTAE